MSQSVTVKIPEDVYSVLLQRAVTAGRSVEDLIAEWVAQRAQQAAAKLTSEVTPEEVEARRQWLEKYCNLCSDPNASDNKRIDADLAKDYER